MHASNLRRSLAGAATAAVAVALGLASANPALAQDEDTSEVSVVHGIPNQDVDVYLDGALVLESFPPREVTEPLELPAGTYEIVLTEPGGDPENDPLVSDDAVEIPADENLSLVAHLDEDGLPSLTAFTNDVDDLNDDARITVRHAAAAPEVDVQVNGETVFSDLANGDEDTADESAGTLSVEVVEAGNDTAVLGPEDVELSEGTLTVVYAIGSLDEDTLELLIQEIRPDENDVTPAPAPDETPTPTPDEETPTPTPDDETPTPDDETPTPDDGTPQGTPTGMGGVTENALV